MMRSSRFLFFVRRAGLFLGSLTVSLLAQSPSEDEAPLSSAASDVLAALRAAGFGADPRALAALPEAAQAAELRCLQEIVRRVGALDKAAPATRLRFVLVNDREDQANLDPAIQPGPQSFFPLAEARAKEVGREPLPVILVPSSAALDRIEQACAQMLEKPAESGLPYACTLYFEPAALAPDLVLPCPMPAEDLHGPVVNPLLKSFVDVGIQGKAVVQAKALAKVKRALKKSNEAGILGELAVLAYRPGLYLARLSGTATPFTTWAVPVADANGAARSGRPAVTPESGSWFENTVETEIEVPRLGRHRLCVFPRPRPQGSEDEEIWKRPRPTWRAHRVQERVVITREMLAASPCIVLLQAPTWKPFMEDIILANRSALRKLSGGRTLAIVLALDAELSVLLDAVGAYYGVDALDAAERLGWMKELEALRAGHR
jgi:hypothetical protein